MLTYKYRVKDATSGKYLNRHARAVNYGWNYCCEIQREAQRRWRAGMQSCWPTAFDLIKLCTGTAADLGLHSDTVQTVCRQFIASRDAKRGCPRFRASSGPRRKLGWIAFIPPALKVDGSMAVYLKRKFCFWMSREIEGEFKAGAFVQDARGRWYISFQCEVSDNLPTGSGTIGIDLGLKTLAACSNGSCVPTLGNYRRYEASLARAQRARSKKRVQAIHTKIANARRHQLHEESTRIARENSVIVVGNVSPAKLAKTRMAKSVLDAGWSMLRNMLAYKARRHQACFIEVDERLTSATCSECLALSGPKGIAGLQMRHWECPNCGCSHDRDVNAARNILRVGLERQALAAEIPAL